MESINIQISPKDKELLQRIATSNNRRFADLVQILFAEGVRMFFCDEQVCIEKLPEEYTTEDKKQLELNAEIEKGSKTWEEQKAAGYKHVATHLFNESKKDPLGHYSDSLIDPLSKRIAAFAIK